MAEKEKSVSGDGDSARPWQSYHTVFTNAKAGMEGVDKEKVQRVVYEMSKGSKYFENEERKEAFLKQKIDNMRAQQAKLTATDIAHYQKIADKRVVELEATRDLSRIWLHVDMDAFYAAVETLCDPSLKGKPMAVGGLSMLSTANYEARKFGVRAAMPGFIARKLCPELVFVPVDFKKYTHYSGLTRKVFQKYDPNFVAASLDEAYLDITNICNDRGMTGAEVAEELRTGVYEETGLTCSAGVAPNRLLAKVCSDINKPNGQFVLPNERMAVMTFISSLPIRKIGGIGKVTESVLKDVFGIKTCEDMLQKSSFICALFSRSSADFFLSVALGLGGTHAPEGTVRKSMSNERTFASTDNEASLIEKLVDLAENLSGDMKKDGLSGRTLTLKLKTSSFEVRTRAVTLQTFICSSEDILKHAMKLLKAELPVSLRLMGLRMSHFSEGGRGGTIDPKQRTLHNFIVPEDASGRTGEHSLVDSVSNKDTLSNDQDIYTSNDPQWTCEPFDFMNANQIPGLDPIEYGHGNDAESRENFGFQADDSNKNRVPEDMVNSSRNQFQCGAAQLDGGDSSSAQLAQNCLDQPKQVDSCVVDEQSPCNSKEPIFWLDGYRCSVCGIELPPSFEEERQEHFDFHFAERLQEEESSNVQRNLPRILPKEQMSQGRKKKKLKASPSQSKHIPIDIFFPKANHTP